MLKVEIRKRELLRRKTLSKQECLDLNEQLLVNFKKLDFSEIKTLHIFLPIEEKNEPNTFLFINWLKIAHPQIKIVAPKADFETNTMQSFDYDANQLLKSDYHILEPTNTSKYEGNIDAVLVPLLAFDQRGYRVGYGKGFYDRFLSKINTLKIGVSFFEAIETISDTTIDDIKLDLCITPNKIVKF